MDAKYKLKITPLAYSDIDKALAYISQRLMNPDAAINLLDEIEKEINNIRDYPRSYPDCKYYFIPSEDYRHTLIGNYALFFRVVDDSHTVEVLRFLYTRMDFSKIQISLN